MSEFESVLCVCKAFYIKIKDILFIDGDVTGLSFSFLKSSLIDTKVKH